MHVVRSKALLQTDKCLVMQPELIKVVGKSAALLLQQIHYWIENKNVQGKVHLQRKWIANSYEDWAADLKIVSRSTINRSVKTLKHLGILSVEKLSTFKNNRTNWYTINYDQIAVILAIPRNNEDFAKTDAPKKTALNESASEGVKMNQCSIQNEPMYIDKITNKENIIYPIKSNPMQKTISQIQKQDIPITQQMLDIWNEIINPEVKAKLTKERCQQLMAALKLKFNNNLEKWKEYCLQIISSDFLMGKIRNGFKVALDAALKFSFIQKIFEKQFGVKDVCLPLDSKDLILNQIESSSDSLEVKRIRYKIIERVGHASYISWFKNAYIKLSATSIEIVAPTRFMKDYLENNYKTDLEKLTGKEIKVQSKQLGTVMVNNLSPTAIIRKVI